VFVSDLPEHRFFVLTVFGEFRYLTDNWNPRLTPSESLSGGDDFNVFYVFNTRTDPMVYDVAKVGDLHLRGKVDGPLSLSDLSQLTDFQPNSVFRSLVARTTQP
jgi:hypothetical protein